MMPELQQEQAATARRFLVIRNVLWLSSERVLQFAIALLVGAYVARYLGPARYGLLMYAVAFSVLVLPLSTSAQTLVVRDLIRSPEREPAILGSAALVSAATLAAAVTVIAGIGLGTQSDVFSNAAPLLLLLFVGVAFRPFQVVDYWFQAHLKAKHATLSRNGALLVMAVVRCVLVVEHARLWTFALAISCEALIGITAQLVLYKRARIATQSWSIDKAEFRRLLHESLPLITASASVVIYMRIDQVMLGGLSSTRATGLYAVAASLSEVSYFLPVAIAASLTPGLTALHSTDRDAFAERLQHMFTGLVVISYAVVVGSIVVGGPLIHALYGRAYTGTVTPFLILMSSAPFVFMGVAQGAWNVLEHRQVLAMVRATLAGVLNVGLNFLLLPRYGATGAAITTVIAQVTSSFLGNAFAQSTWPMLRMGVRALLLLDVMPAVHTLLQMRRRPDAP